MDRKNVQDLYPLSPMQQGMLFHSVYAPETGVYVEQLSCTLRGQVDVPAFKQAWQYLLNRHTVLRTAFLWEGVKEPTQVVLRTIELPLDEQDWRSVSADERRARLDAYLSQQQTRGFDLAQPPLIRVALLRFADDAYYFVWTHHHILLDGWSIPLLLQEFMQIYAAASRGLEPPLKPARPFRDYIVWLRKQKLADAEAYWRRTLKGFAAPTPLTVERLGLAALTDHEAQQSLAAAELEVNLPEPTSAALQAFARGHGLTLNTVVLGAWALLLSRYSSEEDVLFGATVSGRPPELPGAENMLGLFINTLPVRVHVPAEAAVAPWLKALQSQQAEMRQFEFTPLMDIQGWSDVPRGLPLFRSIFVFENFPIDVAAPRQQHGSVWLEDVHSTSHTNYPLTIVAMPGREVLLRISYDPQLFDAATIGRMMGHLRTLIEGFIADPRRRLADVPLLTPAEAAHVISIGNDPWADYESEALIHTWFEAQAAATPEALAVNLGTLDGESPALTYDQLNRRANQLAHHLRQMGVGPGAFVGLFVERSLDMVVAILGILKAGGAYVPLDPAYPPDRIHHIIEDSGVGVLLTQKHLSEFRDQKSEVSDQLSDLRPPTSDLKVLFLDADWPQISRCPAANLAPNVSPSSAAYVIYTSGSTGKPKGVPVTHTNVVRLFTATHPWYSFGAQDVWTLFHSYAFDFSVWELWGALFYGGRVVVAPYHISRSPEAFYQLLCREGVTVLNQTPSAFRQLVRAEEAVGACPDLALRYVIFGGEALELQSLRPWFQRHGDARPLLVNMYGITETTVHVTYRPIRLTDVNANSGSVIGVPIPDLQIYLLDPRQQPTPIGVPGEICVGGAGLAHGYWHRPELTAQRFIADGFSPRPGQRLYRSGDLARRLPNGDIEYLGRIDHQVKIRGFRVELGEIESVLVQHPHVREAIVLVRNAEMGEQHKQLVAWVVPAAGATLTTADLRAHLSKDLPDYMIPAVFVPLDKLPLTEHGKIDRRALPAPNLARLDLGAEYAPPRTAFEQTLAGIWAEALGVEKVGIHDSFFALGGDSILSLSVVAKARQQGLAISPRLLFEHPTLAELAAALERKPDEGPEPEAEAEALSGPIPLTPVQHWFFAEHPRHPQHFNTSMLLEVGEEMDPRRVKETLRVLLAHHDALRLTFRRTDAGWEQTLLPEPKATGETPLPFSIIDLAAMPPRQHKQAIEQAAAREQISFRLEQGPLVRVAYFDLGRKRPGRLLFTFHHLVTDGVSWRILLEDFAAVYSQLQRGQDPTLPAKSTSYGRWARQLASYAQSEAVSRELAYWQRLKAAPLPALPVDFPGGANTYGAAAHLTTALTPEETQILLQQAPAALGAQPHEIMLAALTSATAQWMGQPGLLIEMEGHGREDVLPGLDVSRTVGWFTSIYPVLLDTAAARTPPEEIEIIRKQLGDVPQNGLGFGLLRYLAADEGVRQQMAALPRPHLNFNYLGQFDHIPADVKLPVRLAKESSGAEQDPGSSRSARLYVVSIVSGGQLGVRWLYSRELHKPATIKKLANLYGRELRRFITLAGAPVLR